MFDTGCWEWIKELKSDKAMAHPWVFAGSAVWTDETTGQRYYQADGGDFICVSNFPTAMFDLPVASSESNDGLLFAAWTERIPPLGTKVRLVLIPQLKRNDEVGKTEQQEPAKPAAP